MYQDTITLFNRIPGGNAGDSFYPTVIKNVNLNIDRAAILAKYGPDTKDSAVLHIRYRNKDGEIVIVCDSVKEKSWRSPKAWNKTGETLTFNPDGDFFIKGEWDGGIVSDVEHGPDGFYAKMNREHDYVFAVSSVAQYSVVPHFEIMGK